LGVVRTRLRRGRFEIEGKDYRRKRLGGDVDLASLAARAGGVSTSSTPPGATVDGEVTEEYWEVAGVELGR
jgi:hypothetical protein